jgi:hypothetical protein
MYSWNMREIMKLILVLPGFYILIATGTSTTSVGGGTTATLSASTSGTTYIAYHTVASGTRVFEINGVETYFMGMKSYW